MSPIDELFEGSASYPFETDPTAGRPTQNGEERLARFREEIDIQIANFEEEKWRFGPNENIIKALNAAKEAADETSILGNAEAAVKKIFRADELGFMPAGEPEAQRAVKDAANRATSGKIFVPTPKEPNKAYADAPEFTPPEPPKELSQRESFNQSFQDSANNQRYKLGEDKHLVKSTALNAVISMLGDAPTHDRAEQWLIARCQGKITGYTDTLKVPDAEAILAIIDKAIETAESATGYTTKKHIERATPLIVEYIAGKTSGGMLLGKERALQYIPHRYTVEEAQKLTVSDFLNKSGMMIGLNNSEREEIEQILKDAVAYAQEKIDTPEIDLVAEHTASVVEVEQTAPEPANDQAPEGVAPSIAAASRAMADPQQLSAAMNTARGEPAPKELSFVQLINREIRTRGDSLSRQQIALLGLMREMSEPSKDNIWQVGYNFYRAQGINAQERDRTITIAQNISEQVYQADSAHDLQTDHPHPEEEIEDLSFVELFDQKMQELSDQLSTEQTALITLLKENGCFNRSDILDVANKLYKAGGIDREEAEEVVDVATEIWAANARRLEDKYGFPDSHFDERPGGVD